LLQLNKLNQGFQSGRDKFGQGLPNLTCDAVQVWSKTCGLCLRAWLQPIPFAAASGGNWQAVVALTVWNQRFA